MNLKLHRHGRIVAASRRRKKSPPACENCGIISRSFGRTPMSRLAAILLLIIAAVASAQVATPPAPAPGEITILIAPLRGIGEDGKTAWISQAIQHNLLNDLTRMQSVHPTLPA